METSNVFFRYVTPLAFRCRGDHTYVFLKQMIERERWSREQHLDLQLRKMRTLLIHCQAEVPYYSDLFREVGFDPSRFKTMRDLSVLPILTKGIIRREGDRLIARNYRSRLLVHHTGGSTGRPLTFFRHKDYEELGFAGVLRNFRQCGWRTGERIAQFWGFGEKQLNASPLLTGIKASISRVSRYNAFDVSQSRVAQWHSELTRIRPTVLFGYASTLFLFARTLEELGLSLRGIKGVFVTAETLYEFQRVLVERVVGAKVHNAYGSTEVLDVSCECPCGKMHLRTDSAVVEVGDDSQGCGKELILTSLNNFAMPYLRYRNDDRGDLLDGECGCGNQSPLMTFPLGRTFGNFLTPSGKIANGQFFVKLVYDLVGVERFQFHQIDLRTVILRIVKNLHYGESTGARIARAVEKCKQIMGQEVDIKVEYVSEIPVTLRGKYLYTRSEVLNAGSGGEDMPCGPTAPPTLKKME